MRRTTAASCLFTLLVARLAAQGEPPVDETLRRLLEVLSDPEAMAAQNRNLSKRLLLSQTPRDATTAVVVMPEAGDVVRLRCANGLELYRTGAGGTDETRGSWSPMYPGPFTAQAFGPHTLVVAMQTGNASPQTTIVCFVRADATQPFALAAQAVVVRVEWTEPQRPAAVGEAPQHASVLAWQPASRTATIAFPFAGLDRVVVADVVLASAVPQDAPDPLPGGRRRRVSVLRTQPAVTATGECLGPGSGAAALDVDGELHVFVMGSSQLGREGPVRVHVRDREGRWSRPPVDAAGVRVEPEFTAFRDAGGRICLTTPVSDVCSDRAHPARAVVQTLRTFRLDAEGRWMPAEARFAWSGALRLGQQLRVATAAGRPPTVVLQTAAGELVAQAQSEPAPRDR